MLWWTAASVWFLCSAGNLLLSNNQLSGTVPSQLTSAFPTSTTTWSNNCIVNASTSQSGCDRVERPALLDFYLSTGGPYWPVNTGWLTAAHPCSWYGVGCLGGSTSSGPVVYVTACAASLTT